MYRRTQVPNSLCLDCGQLKVPHSRKCEHCGAIPTRRMGLNRALTNKYLPLEAVEKLGEVIMEINFRCDDPGLRYWTFIHFVSSTLPFVVSARLHPDLKAIAEEILDGLSLPSFADIEF